MRYCTYITIYSGKLLPPFYIGQSFVAKVQAGYKGSVSSAKYKKIWLNELESAPYLFTTRIIKTFETRTEAREHELYLLRHFRAHKNPMYINRCIAGAQFATDEPMTDDHRAKLSAAAKGRKATQETKDKLSRVRKGHRGYTQGMKFSSETKAKMSAAAKGVPKSEEHRKNISDGRKGIVFSEEHKEKIRQARIGTKQSEETKAKKREAWVRRKERGQNERLGI